MSNHELALISPELFQSLLDRLSSVKQDQSSSATPPPPPSPAPPSLDVDDDVRSMALSRINQALTNKGSSDTDRVRLYKRALNSFKKHSEKNNSDHSHGPSNENVDVIDTVGSNDDDDDDDDDESDDDDDTHKVSVDDKLLRKLIKRPDIADKALTKAQMVNVDAILNYVKSSNSRLRYHPTTREIIISGKRVANSDLVHVVRAMVRHLRNEPTTNQTGQIPFVRALLHSEKMPRGLINNRMIIQKLDSFHPSLSK